jgi:hypothetical protein
MRAETRMNTQTRTNTQENTQVNTSLSPKMFPVIYTVPNEDIIQEEPVQRGVKFNKKNDTTFNLNTFSDIYTKPKEKDKITMSNLKLTSLGLGKKGASFKTPIKSSKQINKIDINNLESKEEILRNRLNFKYKLLEQPQPISTPIPMSLNKRERQNYNLPHHIRDTLKDIYKIDDDTMSKLRQIRLNKSGELMEYQNKIVSYLLNAF